MKIHSPIVNYVLIVSLFFLLPFHARAFDYLISFTGSGAATVIDSIRVMNLTTGTSELVPADYHLHLYNISTHAGLLNDNTSSLHSYRESGTENTILSFDAIDSGKFCIDIFSVDGKNIAKQIFQLEKGRHLFQVQLPQGVFIAHVSGSSGSSSVRIISTSAISKNAEINYRGVFATEQQKKIAAPEVTMLYTPGDRLLYKAYSGNYCTIVTDKPTETKTTDFRFVDCTDADGNHYAVVHIGTQTWMAENLKTTKFRTGKSISNVTGYAAWKDATTAAWSVYDNDEKYKNIYGLLYNWYAIIDAKNITPVGWHVPELSEWETLKNYLISNGFNYDGSVVDNKIGKSMAANILWKESTIEGTPGKYLHLNNASGFSALPGGNRHVMEPGAYFNYLTKYVFWWTKTEYNSETVYFKLLGYDTIDLWGTAYGGKSEGYYVRCVKD